MPEPEETKVCTECGQEKPLSEFHVIRGEMTDECLACLRATAQRLKEQDHRRAHARVLLERKAGGCHSRKDVERLYRVQKGRCYYCGIELGDTYHVDHYIPLSRGGSNGPDNLVIACPFCNNSKGTKMPDEWMLEHGKLC